MVHSRNYMLLLELLENSPCWHTVAIRAQRVKSRKNNVVCKWQLNFKYKNTQRLTCIIADLSTSNNSFLYRIKKLYEIYKFNQTARFSNYGHCFLTRRNRSANERERATFASYILLGNSYISLIRGCPISNYLYAILLCFISFLLVENELDE